MATDPTAPLFAEDTPDTDSVLYAKMIEEEAAALLNILPRAAARQWQPSPVPRPRDFSQRASDTHSDPTANTALDPRRLEVRRVIFNSRQALYDAAIALRGSRLAMERAINWYDGENNE